MRNLLRVLTLCIALTLAVPLTAWAATFVTQEVGSTECSSSQDAWTKIKAGGDHRHKRTTSGQTVIFNLPGDGVQRTTNVDWNIFALEWSLSNELGFSYSTSGSYGFCSS